MVDILEARSGQEMAENLPDREFRLAGYSGHDMALRTQRFGMGNVDEAKCLAGLNLPK